MASNASNPVSPTNCLNCNERLIISGFGKPITCKNGCEQVPRCIFCYQARGKSRSSAFCVACDACARMHGLNEPTGEEPTTCRRKSSRTASKKQPTQNRPPPIQLPTYLTSNSVTQTPPMTIPPNIRFSREQKCIACNYSWLMNVDATVQKAMRYPEYIDSVLKCNDCFQAQLRNRMPPTPVNCCVCSMQTANYELNQWTVRLWATSSVPIPISVSCKDCTYGTRKFDTAGSTTGTSVAPVQHPMLSRTMSQSPEMANLTKQPSAGIINLPAVFLKNNPLGPTSGSSDDDALIKLIMNKVFGIDKIAVFDPKNRCGDGCDTEDEDEGPVTKSRAMDTTADERADWPFEWIGDVNTIADLIRLGKTYKPDTRVVTNLDTAKLVRLVEPLERLDAMVGLADVKASIFHQIIFHLQGLDDGMRDMHHTVIKGPPGVGKTEIAHRLAEIYNALGILKTNKVVSVKRDDLIAGYVGQTALKTKKKLEEALGGVLLIDEAYSLGDGSDKDTFSKEAVDLLTSYLSEHGTEFICVIAGYKEALEKRFFSINEGLARRFTIHYEIKPYEGPELQAIFKKTVKDGGWNLADDAAAPVEFFNEHKDDFPSFGGDMLNLFASVKKAHSRRLLGIRTKTELDSSRRQINHSDILAGFTSFMECNGYKKDEKDKKDEIPTSAMHMYN